MSSVENKNPILISADVFKTLDPYHRAAAEVLELHGEVLIEGASSQTPEINITLPSLSSLM